MVLKVSRGHHEATPQEIQDSLNPVPEFLEFTKVAQPADPSASTLGRLFFNTADNRLSFLRRNDGDTAYEVIDLESAGSGTSFIAFTADADLDMGVFDIVNNNIIKFNLTSTTPVPVGTDVAMWTENTGDWHFNVPDTKEFILEINDTAEYEFGAGALSLLGNNLARTQTILFEDGVQTIGSVSDGLEVRQSDLFDFSWWINSVEEYTLNKTGFTFGTNKLIFTAGHEIFDSGSTLTINSGGGINQFVQLETNSLGRLLIADAYVQLNNGANFRANANAVYLDADNDTKWQAGTDDVAQLTIGGITPAVEISVSQAGTVFTNKISTGGGIDLLTNSITNGSIDTSLIDSGILGVARGGTGNGNNARGDILYSPSIGVWSRLPVGAVNTFLRANGTDVAYSTIQLSDLSDVTSKTGTGTIVVMRTSPELISPTINSIGWINANHNHNDTNRGGQIVATTALTATGTKNSTTFLRGDDTWQVPTASVSELNDIGDVNVGVTPTTSTVLIYDGANWVDVFLADANVAVSANIAVTKISGTAVNLSLNQTITGLKTYESSGASITISDATAGAYINMNQNPIEFQDTAVANVGSVGTGERRLFADESNQNGKLSVKTPFSTNGGELEYLEVEGHKHGSISTDTINGYQSIQGNIDFIANELLVGNRMYAIPYIPPEDCQLVEVGIRLDSGNLATAGAGAVIGIYTNSKGIDDGNYPETKLSQTSEIDVTGADTSREATLQSATNLKGGEVYWLVFHQENVATEPDVVAYNGATMIVNIVPYAPSEFEVTRYVGWFVSATYSTTMATSFPSSATKMNDSNDPPAIWVRSVLVA